MEYPAKAGQQIGTSRDTLALARIRDLAVLGWNLAEGLV